MHKQLLELRSSGRSYGEEFLSAENVLRKEPHISIADGTEKNKAENPAETPELSHKTFGIYLKETRW